MGTALLCNTHCVEPWFTRSSLRTKLNFVCQKRPSWNKSGVIGQHLLSSLLASQLFFYSSGLYFLRQECSKDGVRVIFKLSRVVR